LKGDISADADRYRQRHSQALRALNREPQMAAVIELDSGAVRTDQLKAVVGGVVDVRFRVANDHHARGDEAAGIGGRVLQDRQQVAKIDVLAVCMRLCRRLVDQGRRLRIAKRPADELSNAAEVDAESPLAVLLASEKVADDRDVMALDVGEQ
jgi:hypothetical protein